MNKYASDFIKTVLGQIKYKKVHNAIATEIESHIDDLAEEYISDGMGEDEAVKKAISQMGDPEEIGKKLHKTHKPKTEWSIIALTAAIIAFGLFALFSYSATYFDSSYFNNQVIFAAISILVFLFCYFIDYKILEKYSLHLYSALILFLIIMMNLFGIRINGSAYLSIFGFGFNPIVVSIPLLLIFYAGIVKKWCDGNIKNLIKLLSISSLPIIICLIQPSLANAMIIGTGFLMMITFAILDKSFKGNRKKFLLSIYGGITFVFALLIAYTFKTSPYRWERILVFINPQRDPNNAGYLNMILNKLLSSAKFFGKSDALINIGGNSNHSLPGAYSEFIFTFIISSFGWLIGIILTLLLLLIIVRMFHAASKISDRYGKFLSIGICCVFSLQVITNILMNLGYLPIAGISLPFISYGGTNLVCNMALMGMLVGIYRRKDIVLKEVC